MSIRSSLLYACVYIYIVMMFGFSILFVQDFNIVLVFSSFYINSFSFLFSFSSGFLSSSRSHFRERLPNHFRSSFSFVHENNTGGEERSEPFLCPGRINSSWKEIYRITAL